MLSLTVCAQAMFERDIQNMWSQTGLIGHVGNKLSFKKVLNKYIASNCNMENCQYTLQCTTLRLFERFES